MLSSFVLSLFLSFSPAALLSRTDSIELGPEGELGLELVLAELRLWYLRDLLAGGDFMFLAKPRLAFMGVGVAENLTCFGGDRDFERCNCEMVGFGL